MRTIIAVDPSINTCGFAIFVGGKLHKYELIRPKATSEDFVEKGRSVFWQIRQKLTKVTNYIIVLEMPEYWKVAGYAARESGSFFKLAVVVGMIATLPNVVVVTPSQWKGQMTKEVTKNRLQRKYTDIEFDNMDNNIVDAIGIGDWYLSKYKKEK